MLEFHVGEPVVAVEIGLFEDLVGNELHLIRLQLIWAAQALECANKVVLVEVAVAIKIYSGKGEYIRRGLAFKTARTEETWA